MKFATYYQWWRAGPNGLVPLPITSSRLNPFYEALNVYGYGSEIHAWTDLHCPDQGLDAYTPPDLTLLKFYKQERT